MQVRYVTESAIPNLIRLGWLDTAGRELTWRYWQRQRKRYPFIWVPDEEAEAEMEIKPGQSSKLRYVSLGRN
jgi:hypothetical protein